MQRRVCAGARGQGPGFCRSRGSGANGGSTLWLAKPVLERRAVGDVRRRADGLVELLARPVHDPTSNHEEPPPTPQEVCLGSAVMDATYGACARPGPDLYSCIAQNRTITPTPVGDSCVADATQTAASVLAAARTTTSTNGAAAGC